MQKMTAKKIKKYIKRITFIVSAYIFINNKIVEKNIWYNYFEGLA